MARARLRHHAETKAYVARRLTEGKSEKETVRCLKRHLSNLVFRQLLADVRALPEPLDNIEGQVNANDRGRSHALNLIGLGTGPEWRLPCLVGVE